MTERSHRGYDHARGAGRSLWTVFVLVLAGLFLAVTVSASQLADRIDGPVSLLAAADDGGDAGSHPDNPGIPADHACPPTAGGCTAMAMAPVPAAIDPGRSALSPVTPTDCVAGIGSLPQFHPPRASFAA